MHTNDRSYTWNRTEGYLHISLLLSLTSSKARNKRREDEGCYVMIYSSRPDHELLCVSFWKGYAAVCTILDTHS